MHYSIARILTGVHRLVLPQPDGVPAPFDVPSNAYLLQHEDCIALVNTGHRAARPALLAALNELGVSPQKVERVVLTGVWPDVFGNADLFVNADIYGFARPQRVSTWLRERLAQLKRRYVIAAQALHHGRPAGEDTANPELHRRPVSRHTLPDEVTWFLDNYLMAPPRLRTLTPIHAGHTLNLGGIPFQVLDAAGTIADNLALHDPRRGLLFTGDAVQHGDEACWISDTDQLIDSAVSLFQCNAALLMPNRGPVSKAPNRLIKRMSLFANNFLANAPFAIKGPSSAPELVTREHGGAAEVTVLNIATALGYRALLGELFRNDLIDGVGEGLHARFGLGE